MMEAEETYKRFTLNNQLSPEQVAFFNTNGFIHFKKFLDQEQVHEITDALNALQSKWINVKKNNTQNQLL